MSPVKTNSPRVIFCQNLKKSLWKNGGGTTTEVFISPERAALDNFDWRVSFADVREKASAFSMFAGYDRALIVWKGQGLLLNDQKTMKPFETIYFSGDDETRAALLDDEGVADFGLIWKRGKYDGELSVVDALFARPVREHTTEMIFVARGNLTVESTAQTPSSPILLHAMDTLVLNEMEGSGENSVSRLPKFSVRPSPCFKGLHVRVRRL